jgi:hypothetical protein
MKITEHKIKSTKILISKTNIASLRSHLNFLLFISKAIISLIKYIEITYDSSLYQNFIHWTIYFIFV